jgi:hemerythrin
MYSPTLLSWNESLSTGDHDLDTQHKYLFEICNDLAFAIEKKRGPKTVDMVLDVLMFYAESHFKKEEDCMERHHCAFAQRNQKAHSAFIATLKMFQSEHTASTSPDELAIRIHQYLVDWIINHIMHVDTQLHSAIHGKQDVNNGAAASL